MSEQVRNKGIEEIFRVLKPTGRLLVLDIAVPPRVWSGRFLKLILGFLFKHDLDELQPKLESTGFSTIEISRAPFRVLGLPLLSFLKAFKLA